VAGERGRFPSQLKIFAFDRKQICISSFVCSDADIGACTIRFPRFARNRAGQKSRNCVCVSACSRPRSLLSFFILLPPPLYRVCACVRSLIFVPRAERKIAVNLRNARPRRIDRNSARRRALVRVNSWRKLIQDNYRDETSKHINCRRLAAFVASRTRRFPLARWPRWRMPRIFCLGHRALLYQHAFNLYNCSRMKNDGVSRAVISWTRRTNNRDAFSFIVV